MEWQASMYLAIGGIERRGQSDSSFYFVMYHVAYNIGARASCRFGVDRHQAFCLHEWSSRFVKLHRYSVYRNASVQCLVHGHVLELTVSRANYRVSHSLPEGV